MHSPEKWAQCIFDSRIFNQGHKIIDRLASCRTTKYEYHKNLIWRLRFPFSRDLYSILSWQGIWNAASSLQAPSVTSEVMLGGGRLQNNMFRGPDELFDLENDPEDLNNLAAAAGGEVWIRVCIEGDVGGAGGLAVLDRWSMAFQRRSEHHDYIIST